MSRTVLSLFVASLVVLAGCAGGITGQDGPQAQSADSGTVSFYVSDERNAIGQFEHLNVTVTKVGFAQSGDADANATASGEWSVESESENGLELAVDGNATAGENATVTLTHDGEGVANGTVVVSVGENETTVTTDADGTATVQLPTGTEDVSLEAETDSDSEYGESEASLEFEYESESEDGEGDTEWVEHDVDNRTVDLTELQGANATLLGNMTVPAGEYEKVFVHVGEVNGTLNSGEQVNVKLPSQKLHLNEDFTVDSEGSVEFVFDITVFEAGNGGKYILKPVASESGTDVPIERVDDDDDEAEAELEANFVGDVRAGENATVRVTQDGDPVANATVEVAGDVTVTTDANGTATVQVPADAEEFELEASTEEGSDYGEAEAELEVEFGEDGTAEEGDAEDSDAGDSDADESEESNEETESETDAEADLAVAVDGTFAAGENVTVIVTDGEAVEDAEVYVDGELVGETNADGELAFALPDSVDVDSELTVEADGESVVVDSSTVAAAQ